MSDEDKIIEEATSGDYKYGFVSNIDSELAQKGLTEETIRFISGKKNEPEWLLDWRLKAFRIWESMEEPEWAHISYPNPKFQEIIYYAAPKPKKEYESLDEVDPEILKTFEKLGVPINEQKALAGVAVDVVMVCAALFQAPSIILAIFSC